MKKTSTHHNTSQFGTTRFGKHISIIHRYSQIYLTPRLNELNLGTGQYPFLMALYDNNGIIQEQLSKITNLDKTTTARAIKKLEELGYVSRKISEDDKRAQQILLTEKAFAIRPYLEDILNSWNKVLLSNLSDDELLQLISLIQKISTNILDKCSR